MKTIFDLFAALQDETIIDNDFLIYYLIQRHETKEVLAKGECDRREWLTLPNHIYGKVDLLFQDPIDGKTEYIEDVYISPTQGEGVKLNTPLLFDKVIPKELFQLSAHSITHPHKPFDIHLYKNSIVVIPPTIRGQVQFVVRDSKERIVIRASEYLNEHLLEYKFRIPEQAISDYEKQVLQI